MSITTIELNDTEIRVAHDTDIILRSPGYAVIGKDNIELGDIAVKTSHLNPRTAYNKYWHNLNMDSIKSPSSKIRHNADLAYTHLLAIHEQAGKPEEVIFAVPGHYSNEQLSILLGLVEASPFKAIGLVDNAVAAATPVIDSGTYTHAEIYLHQTILTHLTATDQVTRTSTQIIDGIGLAAIYDVCASLISDLFIKQSRFDPQHHPETEQTLYNHIPAYLKSLCTKPETLLEIQYQQAQHQAKLPLVTLLEALQTHYEKILSSIPASNICLLGDRLAELPGFTSQLPEKIMLDQTSVFKGCLEQESAICSTGDVVNFVTQLPVRSSSSVTKKTETSSVEQENPQPATHVLSDYRAYPLTNSKHYFSAYGEISANKPEHPSCSVILKNGQVTVTPESDSSIFFNKQELRAPAQAQTGDIISFSNSETEYVLINVNN